MYGKQKEQINDGFLVEVGRSLHCNRKSLKAYMRRKQREGYKFVGIKRAKICGPPLYIIDLEKKD